MAIDRRSSDGPAWRELVLQLVAIAALALVIGVLADNTIRNMRLRGIQSGFDFLAQPAGFSIGESPIAFDPGRPYWQAFAVGLANTLRVAVFGIVMATILGAFIGIGRLTRNALVRGLCQAYVELFRNTPVLLQLLIGYLLMTELLPASSSAWQVGPLFLSKGGLHVPSPVWGSASFDFPHRGAFAVEGGAALTPEFMAVLVGLTLYTSAFVAEIVRAGIQSVPRGQVEAAAALGLDRSSAMRFAILPQALRVIVPPLTNQYLSLTKNSSLAVAVGYPELVSIANTTLNQTGRAIECITIVMLVYLTTSLATSALMNWYNARTAITS